MILLLGASGYIGQAFERELQRRGVPFRSLSRRQVDYTQFETLRKFLSETKPSFLVNAAGYTGKPNVDACETDKANCLAGNAVLPGVIAEACHQIGIAWGHVSSGCIFTGRRSDGHGFGEIDAPNFSFRQNNCSFYSGTKALGEEVLADVDRCFIWRLRIPFSNIDSPRNYLSKLMRYDTLLEAENSLSELNEFVAAALDCFALNLDFGTYNLTNPGSVTTSEVAAFIQATGVSKKEFQFFDSEDEFMRLAAKTPRSNCVLDSSKAVAAGLRLTPVHEALQRSLEEWQKETSHER